MNVCSYKTLAILPLFISIFTSHITILEYKNKTKLTPRRPAMISMTPVPTVVYGISGVGIPAFLKMSLV